MALVGTWVAGYLLFWGTYAVTVLSDINSFLGPIYYVPALAAAVAIGALTLDRIAERRPRVALGLAAGILVVSVVTAVPLLHNDRHRSDVRRARGHGDRPPSNRWSSSAALVSPVRGPFVGHPFSWLRNRPGLRGDRLVAVEDPTTDFALVDRYRDPRALFSSLINLQPVPTARALVDEVRLVDGPHLRIRCSVATPEPGSTRTIVVGLDGAGERGRSNGASTFDIDVTARQGRIAVEAARFSVPPLSSTATRLHRPSDRPRSRWHRSGAAVRPPRPRAGRGGPTPGAPPRHPDPRRPEDADEHHGAGAFVAGSRVRRRRRRHADPDGGEVHGRASLITAAGPEPRDEASGCSRPMLLKGINHVATLDQGHGTAPRVLPRGVRGGGRGRHGGGT